MSEVFYELYKDEFINLKQLEKLQCFTCAGAVEHHSSSRSFPT